MFVAVNPSPQGWKPFIDTTPPPVKKPQHVPNSSEQVQQYYSTTSSNNYSVLQVYWAIKDGPGALPGLMLDLGLVENSLRGHFSYL